jgi:Ca2+-binding RTX toxin-like protein
MEMPTTLLTGSCGGTSGESFGFNTPDGGGSVDLDVSSISSHGSPGFPGTSNIAAVSADSMAIISTPASTEKNILDFRDMYLLRVAYIDGLGGNDIIIGSKGPDTLRGSSGDDTLSGYLGNDVLQGGDGNDTLNGDCVDPAITDPMLPVADDCGDDGGDDLLLGYECFGPNADCSVALNKGAEVDTLYGGLGKDCMDGGRGNDFLKGGGGSDAFVLWGDSDSDTFTDFTPGNYIPENPGEVDVVVDLTGVAKLGWVKGSKKDNVPNTCQITTGGNNVTILSDIASNDCNTDDVKIIVPANGDSFPVQCAGHPYTFE